MPISSYRENNGRYETPPEGPLGDDELATFIARKIEHSLNREDGELSDVRKKTLSYYRGGPVGIEDPARSTYRTREVFEMVEWTLPSFMSTFFSAKQPIVFEPVSAARVAVAQQVTDTVNHLLFQRENSFSEFHDWFKSALLDPVAYMKVHVVTHERLVHHKYDELTPMGLQKLLDEHEWKDDPEISPAASHTVEVPTFRFEGWEITNQPDYLTEAVPPEEMLIEQEANDLDLDDLFENYGFICHETTVPMSELLARGYDEDELREVGTGDTSHVRFNDERTSRDYREDERPEAPITDWAGTPVLVHECYMKVDIDGDGISEPMRIVEIGGKIFEKEPCEYQPFVALSLIPMPHKHAGISPAESMLDQQELSTKLMRMALDDAYKTIDRKTYVWRQALSRNKGTLDRMMNPEDAIVELEQPPGESLLFEPPSPILDKLLPLQTYVDDKVKKRTGSAPENMMNPDVLRDATAHGMLASMDKTSQRLMHMIRIAAETGVKKVAKKMRDLLRRHQDRAMVLKLRGKFVEVDPAEWDENNQVKVTVGLGFNSKEQRLAGLMQILQLQREALAQGMADPMQLYRTMELMIEDADMGFVEEFFIEPNPEKGWQPPPPPPDPQMEAVKMQQQVEQMKHEGKLKELESQMAQAQMESDTKKEQIAAEMAKTELEMVRLEREASREDILIIERKEAEIAKLEAEVVKLRAEAQKTEQEITNLKGELVKTGADVDKTRAEAVTIKRGDAAPADKEKEST